MRRARLALAVSLLAGAAVVGASARTARAADSRNAEAARLYHEGKYDEALQIYRQLASETRNPGYLCNIGRCHERLGHTDDALASIRQCLAQARPDAKKRAEYEALVADLEDRKRGVAGISAPPPPPPPEVPAPVAPPTQAQPPYAQAPAPYPAYPAPGPAPAGNAPAPLAPPEAAPMATAPQQWTPSYQPPYQPAYQPPEVQAAQATPRRRGLRPVTVISGIVAVAGLGAGVVCGITASKAFDDTSARYDPAREKTGKTFNVLQIVGYGVAVVGAAVAVITGLSGSGAPGGVAGAPGSRLIAGTDGVGWRF